MTFLPSVFCGLDLGNLGGHDNWIVLSELSFTGLSEVKLAVVIFGKSMGLAESGLTLAFVPQDTDLLAAFIALVSFLLYWLGLLFDNFNRLDCRKEVFFIDGGFMAH